MGAPERPAGFGFGRSVTPDQALFSSILYLFFKPCLGGTAQESPLQGFGLETALRDGDGPSRRVEVSVHQHGGQLGLERS